nr:hypothetical protein GCM10020092_101490 [Actinoplanes digitatis]
MPVVEATIVVPVPPDVAFAVSQTTAPVRYRWDPFVREQHFVDGATRPGKGVRTFTRSRHGISMVSEYVSFQPPTNVGMKMVRGPWFFEMFGGGWRFAAAPGRPGHTVATWRYNFRCLARVSAPGRRSDRPVAARPRHPPADRRVRAGLRGSGRARRGPPGPRRAGRIGRDQRRLPRRSNANLPRIEYQAAANRKRPGYHEACPRPI